MEERARLSILRGLESRVEDLDSPLSHILLRQRLARLQTRAGIQRRSMTHRQKLFHRLFPVSRFVLDHGQFEPGYISIGVLAHLLDELSIGRRRPDEILLLVADARHLEQRAAPEPGRPRQFAHLGEQRQGLLQLFVPLLQLHRKPEIEPQLAVERGAGESRQRAPQFQLGLAVAVARLGGIPFLRQPEPGAGSLQPHPFQGQADPGGQFGIGVPIGIVLLDRLFEVPGLEIPVGQQQLHPRPAGHIPLRPHRPSVHVDAGLEIALAVVHVRLPPVRLLHQATLVGELRGDPLESFGRRLVLADLLVAHANADHRFGRQIERGFIDQPGQLFALHLQDVALAHPFQTLRLDQPPVVGDGRGKIPHGEVRFANLEQGPVGAVSPGKALYERLEAGDALRILFHVVKRPADVVHRLLGVPAPRIAFQQLPRLLDGVRKIPHPVPAGEHPAARQGPQWTAGGHRLGLEKVSRRLGKQRIRLGRRGRSFRVIPAVSPPLQRLFGHLEQSVADLVPGHFVQRGVHLADCHPHRLLIEQLALAAGHPAIPLDSLVVRSGRVEFLSLFKGGLQFPGGGHEARADRHAQNQGYSEPSEHGDLIRIPGKRA